MATPLLILRNGESAPRAALPELSFAEFRETLLREVAAGQRVSALFGVPAERGLRLVLVLADDAQGHLGLAAATVGETYPSLTRECPQAALFEREIAEQWDVRPDGHPWLKRVRFHAPYRRGADVFGAAGAEIAPGVADYFRVEGDDVHEVAVGPVHAGVIEPGHFRFQCFGEEVMYLEISLGYQHRGVERSLSGGPGPRTIHTMETLAGDTTIGHATAYCEALESLGGAEASTRAQAIRAVALELERLACHVGDLGALANDVGFLPTASYCGRLRGDALNMTALLCGSRFGRGLVRPGGVRFDVEPSRRDDLLARLDALERDTTGAVKLLWEKPSVMARFEETGIVETSLAREIGLVGPAARASGLDRDVRRDHAGGAWREATLRPVVENAGDVCARARVRWGETLQSIALVRELLRALPDGPLAADVAPPAADRVAVTLVEGWRGEICHVALTGANGRLDAYKVVDPSFHNWFGLACALRGQQISDFPLCNKSFNLSYCGHDL